MNRAWIVVLALSMSLGMGCGKSKKKRSSGGGEGGESPASSKLERSEESVDLSETVGDDEAERPAKKKARTVKRKKRSGGDVPEWFVSIAAKIPADVEGVGGANVSNFFTWIFDDGILPMKAFNNMSDLRKDLSVLIHRHVGFDVFAAEHFALFKIAGSEVPIIALTGDWGRFSPKGKTVMMDGREAHQMENDMYIMKYDGTLWISDPNGLTMITAVSDGKKPSFANSDLLGDMAFSVSSTVDGDPTMFGYIGAAEPLRMMLEEFRAPSGIRLDSFAVAIDEGGDMGLGVYGDALSMDQIYSLVQLGRKQAQAMLKQFYDEGRGSDNLEQAIETVTGYHFGMKALQSVETKKVKDGVVLRAELGVPEIGLMGGVVFSIAIPTFVKYTNRAKTTEAIDQLDKIYKGSAFYYATPHVERGTGLKLPCQFPPSQSMTPDVTGKKCCGGINDKDGDDRCDVNVEQWTTPTWSALNFQMNDQHYFGYSYESSGTGSAARFTATANADLDCDGILSTFQRFGYGDESASAAECSMKGSAAFYTDKDTE